MKARYQKLILIFGLSLGLLLGTVYTAYFGGEMEAAPASAYFATDTALTNETAVITLAQDASSVSGNGAVVDGNTIHITKGGVYRLTGTLEDGQIYVKVSDKQSVVLILDGVSITNPEGPAVYVKNSGNLALYLEEGSENTVVSGTETEISADAADEEASEGAITFKDDATIYGSGSLTVCGYINNGIHCSNNLFIEDGTITVTAVNNGIKGKDTLTVDGGTIRVVSGNDGLKSNDETGEGYGVVTINGGSISIISYGDGVQAETLLTVNDGDIDITTVGEDIVHTDEMFGMMGGGPGGGIGGPGQRDGSFGDEENGEQGGQMPPMGNPPEIPEDMSEFGDMETWPEPPEGMNELEEGMKVDTKESSADEPNTQDDMSTEGKGSSTDDPNPQNDMSTEGKGSSSDVPNLQDDMNTEEKGSSTDTTDTREETDEAGKDHVSCKGLKSHGNLVINGGTFNIDSVDDSIHCDGEMVIAGGTMTLSTEDDGIHADVSLVISDAVIEITDSYEGIESNQITVNSGDITLTASDDGFNANGGPDNGFGMGFGGWNMSKSADNTGTDSDQADADSGNADGDADQAGAGSVDADSTGEEPLPTLTINGGTIRVNASGDGLDSNGNLIINGGLVLVDGPSDSANGALDCGSENGGTILVNGGTLLAIGSSGMAEVPDEASAQYTLSTNTSFAEGCTIIITDAGGTVLLEHEAKESGNSIIFSSEELAMDETYTVSVDGEETEITITSIVTGATSGGMMGGGMMGGGMGGGREGISDGFSFDDRGHGHREMDSSQIAE